MSELSPLQERSRVRMWLTKLFVVVYAVLIAPVVMAEQVVVAVAANFTGVVRELVPLFEMQTGHRVKISYGSTGKLYAQIQNGAPYDVFLAADAERPQRAMQEGLAVAGSAFTYARGQLVLWSVTPGLFAQDSGLAYLIQGDYSRLGIANPKTAPYGQAAQTFLRQNGLWRKTERRIVRGDSIAQTFQFVATGNAQLGFVALSQLKEWQGPGGSVWLPSDDQILPIIQQAVLLKRGAANTAAQAFVAFLKSDAARAVIMRAGYGVDD